MEACAHVGEYAQGMYACGVCADVQFLISPGSLKRILCLQTLFSFQRRAEMFDIAEPRKHSGTAELAKLSP